MLNLSFWYKTKNFTMDSEEKGWRSWFRKNQYVINPVLSVIAIIASSSSAFFGAKEGTKIVMNNVLKNNASANATQTTFIASAGAGNFTTKKDVLGVEDSVFNIDDWTLEKGILKKDGLFCNTGRKGFEVVHILLNEGLKVGERITMRVRLSKNGESEGEAQDPKFVIMYDENYRMFVPGKDIGFIEFDNAGKSVDPKNLKDQIDISKDIVLEYFIKHVASNRVYFGFKITFTPVGSEQQAEVPGQFYSDFDADPISLPARKFGIGTFEGTCIDIKSFAKTPLEDSNVTAQK